MAFGGPPAEPLAGLAALKTICVTLGQSSGLWGSRTGGEDPFGAMHAGEVTLCQLFWCPHEDRHPDCFVPALVRACRAQ